MNIRKILLQRLFGDILVMIIDKRVVSKKSGRITYSGWQILRKEEKKEWSPKRSHEHLP